MEDVIKTLKSRHLDIHLFFLVFCQVQLLRNCFDVTVIEANVLINMMLLPEDFLIFLHQTSTNKGHSYNDVSLLYNFCLGHCQKDLLNILYYILSLQIYDIGWQSLPWEGLPTNIIYFFHMLALCFTN